MLTKTIKLDQNFHKKVEVERKKDISTMKMIKNDRN